MDISKYIADLKKDPGFAQNVGMVLVHNGIVRAWSRKDGKAVSSVKVQPDQEKMEQICREIRSRPGIYHIFAHAVNGELKPGDDLLYLVVAGDIRENVKSAFAELLDRIKAEAVIKEEILA